VSAMGAQTIAEQIAGFEADAAAHGARYTSLRASAKEARALARRLDEQADAAGWSCRQAEVAADYLRTLHSMPKPSPPASEPVKGDDATPPEGK
jgi:hypothetical protein